MSVREGKHEGRLAQCRPRRRSALLLFVVKPWDQVAHAHGITPVRSLKPALLHCVTHLSQQQASQLSGAAGACSHEGIDMTAHAHSSGACISRPATIPANIIQPMCLLLTNRAVRFSRSLKSAVRTCHSWCPVLAAAAIK